MIDDLLELACLHYGVRPGDTTVTGFPDSPARRAQAVQLLQQHPELARASLHAAVVCGDLAEVERLLAARPAAATEAGGREGWLPLVFLCYGRLPVPAASDDAVAIATRLLDSGADPNSSWQYLWDGRPMVWSALCGVIGDGESGVVNCPPHPQADALAELLLSRGADPNQSQALYNTMLRRDDDHWLRVLIAHGLTARHLVAWEPRDTAPPLFDDLLAHAVERGHSARARLLLEKGANARAAGLAETAVRNGCTQIAELLVEHGGVPARPREQDAFRIACLRGDAETARALLAADPSRLEEAGVLLVDEAARRDLVDVARLLLDLGVSPDFVQGAGGYRALHRAACEDAAGVAALLLERGADAGARDAAHESTPLGWAVHAGQPRVMALLRDVADAKSPPVETTL